MPPNLPLVVRQSPRPFTGLLMLIVAAGCAGATWHWWASLHWLAATITCIVATAMLFGGLDAMGRQEWVVDLKGVNSTSKAPILGATDWHEPLSAYQGVLHQADGKTNASIVLKHADLLLQGHNVNLARYNDRSRSRVEAEELARLLGLNLLEHNAAGTLEVQRVAGSENDNERRLSQGTDEAMQTDTTHVPLRSDGAPSTPFPRLGSLTLSVRPSRWILTKRSGQQSTLIFLLSSAALMAFIAAATWHPELIPSGKRMPILATIISFFLGSAVFLVVRLATRERLELSGGQLMYGRATLGFMRVRQRFNSESVTSVRSVALGLRGHGRFEAQAYGLVIRSDEIDLECFEELHTGKQLAWVAADLSARLGCASSNADRASITSGN